MIRTRILVIFTWMLSSSFFVRQSDMPEGIHPDWIIGTWEMKTDKGSVFESWIKHENGNYEGTGYKLVNGEKRIRERIELIVQDGIYFYIPSVPDQNDGAPVPFKCTLMTETEMVFENPQHDFPQRISYRLISETELLAEISGSFRGKQVTEQFPLTRVH